VFIIPRLRATLRQLKAAVEYGQVMPNMPQMGRFFSFMSRALQIATESRAYHRRLLYA
jgi:maltose-binding protein MalE